MAYLYTLYRPVVNRPVTCIILVGFVDWFSILCWSSVDGTVALCYILISDVSSEKYVFKEFTFINSGYCSSLQFNS